MSDTLHMASLPPARCELALNQLDTWEQERLQGNPTTNQHSDGTTYSVQTSRTNRTSNRWTDILAYDHSLLPGTYLNASSIPVFPLPNVQHDALAARPSSPPAFIASQAPLPSTLTTFYDKVAEHDVRLLVNLTPFRERGRTKADQYWPMDMDEPFETEPEGWAQEQHRYGITLMGWPEVLDEALQATSYPLQLFRQSPNGQVGPRTFVTVLHVTSWADFGNYPTDVFARLLDLIDRCSQAGTHPNGASSDRVLAPIWVHCSAGVGRSGTVIAALLARRLGHGVDALTALGQSTTQASKALTSPGLLMEASLAGAVTLIDHTRKYRPRMVQTPEQLAMVANVVAQQIKSTG